MPKELLAKYEAVFSANLITGKVMYRYFEDGILQDRMRKARRGNPVEPDGSPLLGIQSIVRAFPQVVDNSFHAAFFASEFAAAAKPAAGAPPPATAPAPAAKPAAAAPIPAKQQKQQDAPVKVEVVVEESLGVKPFTEEELSRVNDEGAMEIATNKIDEVLSIVGTMGSIDQSLLSGIGAQIVGSALDFVGKALAGTPFGVIVGPVWAAAGAIFDASMQVVENRYNCARLTALILELSNCLTKTDRETLKSMKKEINDVRLRMEECVELVKKFVGKKWWKKMLTSSNDQQDFEEAHRDLDEVSHGFPACVT